MRDTKLETFIIQARICTCAASILALHNLTDKIMYEQQNYVYEFTAFLKTCLIEFSMKKPNYCSVVRMKCAVGVKLLFSPLQ